MYFTKNSVFVVLLQSAEQVLLYSGTCRRNILAYDTV